MKTKQILRPSEVERKLETSLLYTYTTLTQLRKDIKRILKPHGIVRELDVVPQISDAYQLEFELDFGDDNYYYIQVYYTKCRTRKIFTVEIGVET